MDIEDSLVCSPNEATHIRIIEQLSGKYELDAADNTGRYTEEVWTYFNGVPLTQKRAKEVAPLFCEKIGRLDLVNNVIVIEYE